MEFVCVIESWLYLKFIFRIYFDVFEFGFGQFMKVRLVGRNWIGQISLGFVKN